MAQTAPTQRIEDLFNMGTHLGHKKNRVHPKTRKYIYRMVNGTSVIDLTQTMDQLENAKKFLAEVAKEQKTVLVVGTKKVAASFLKEYCSKNNLPHITTKWLPGLLTNFETLMKNVHKLIDMKQKEENGDWEALVKHERIKLSKEKAHLEKLYGGLTTLKNKPDVMIVVDPRKEKNAITEARAFNIPIVAMMDTNSNPELINHLVMANDDTAVVVKHIMQELLDSYTKIKSNVPQQ